MKIIMKKKGTNKETYFEFTRDIQNDYHFKYLQSLQKCFIFSIKTEN